MCTVCISPRVFLWLLAMPPGARLAWSWSLIGWSWWRHSGGLLFPRHSISTQFLFRPQPSHQVLRVCYRTGWISSLLTFHLHFRVPPQHRMEVKTSLASTCKQQTPTNTTLWVRSTKHRNKLCQWKKNKLSAVIFFLYHLRSIGSSKLLCLPLELGMYLVGWTQNCPDPINRRGDMGGKPGTPCDSVAHPLISELICSKYL